MITVFTNRPEFQNDIAEIIRAFLGFVEIAFVERALLAGYMLEVCLVDDAVPYALAKGRKVATLPFAVHTQPVAAMETTPLRAKRQEKRALKTALYQVMKQLEAQVQLPWGSLTGIRPTRLLRELMEKVGEQEALRLFSGYFDVSHEKAVLANEIVGVQRPMLKGVSGRDASVYVAIPYCKTRCLYCSFLSEVVGCDGVPGAYLDALYADIHRGASILDEGGFRVRSVYIGGGTPTVLSAMQLQGLLAHIKSCYGGSRIPEWTVEAGRPDTLDIEKLSVLKRAGVERISLNPQSMQESTLRRIGRSHTPQDIRLAMQWAREIGFACINMDLIMGLPGEALADVRDTLAQIEALAPENLTVHTLAIKRSSRLKTEIETHMLPHAAQVEQMLQLAQGLARSMSMQPYYMYRQKYMRGNLENVGYAKAGLACTYNVDMMEETVSIMAHGAGAMSKRVFPGRDKRVERIPAPKDIPTYISKQQRLYEEKRALFL